MYQYFVCDPEGKLVPPEPNLCLRKFEEKGLRSDFLTSKKLREENGVLLRRNSGSASIISSFREDVESLQLIYCWWLCKMVHLLLKLVGQFFMKVNILTIFPSILGFCILVHSK